MKQRFRIALAVALGLSSAALSAGRQSATKPRPTGIPECDKYFAMVTACMPKMCEDERLLRELDLGFHHELLPDVVKLKGRQEAANVCARMITEAIKDDSYGCYAPKTADAGAPKAIRLDKVRPTDSSVTLTFSGNGPADDEEARVVIVRSIGERPFASYPLSGWKGQFVLDTASATPVVRGTRTPPIRLDPRTTYCFFVDSSTGDRSEIYRKGIFTTLPKR